MSYFRPPIPPLPSSWAHIFLYIAAESPVNLLNKRTNVFLMGMSVYLMSKLILSTEIS